MEIIKNYLENMKKYLKYFEKNYTNFKKIIRITFQIFK